MLGQKGIFERAVSSDVHIRQQKESPGIPEYTPSSGLPNIYGSIYQYNTLSEPAHDRAWTDAKTHNTMEYINAETASHDAICGTVADPTGCATDYCAYDPSLFRNK